MTRTIGIVLISVLALTSVGIVNVDASSVIKFNDINLHNALCKNYDFEGVFTEEKAIELSKDKKRIVIQNANISDLEGVQYFVNTKTVYVGGNKLRSLKPISELKQLGRLDISNNSIKGKKFEKMLIGMGKVENLDGLLLDNDGIVSIKFLDKIGDIKNYTEICMRNNKISDISVLKGATNLEMLDMQNNRITDVSPLKDLDKLTWCIDLRDNCIIDYKPIKHLFDQMWEEFDGANAMTRYDYYTNPINYKYNGKKIKFPYLTVYYQYQGYADAIPLFKAIGGSAKYDKKAGTLTCTYDGKVIIMKDFSTICNIDGKIQRLDYPMRRMQYDLAYIPVKDICNILGLSYNEVEQEFFLTDDEEPVYAPKLVEISK